MEKLFTLHSRKVMNTLSVFIFLLFSSFVVNAQIGCANETVLWSENFGTGTGPTSSPDVTSLVYQPTETLDIEGTYRIMNSTQQMPEWHASEDFTSGDVDGKMLVINGEAETFYEHVITRPNGFADGMYSMSLYLMNVNTVGTCAPNPLLPLISIRVEYLDASNAWVALSGSPYTTGHVPQSPTPTWLNIGSYFTLPFTGNFAPTQMRVVLSDGTEGGCGNDFAIDDLKFALCPEGAPMPVTFLNINAQPKGSGVSINWSTSQEINNNYFEVQKSADGNSNWNVVTTVNGAGNSQVVKNYNAFDANPLSGYNYYRIKQVDKDGKFDYSKTVNVKLNINKTAASVLINPFRSSLSIDFSSAAGQVVSARLIDVTGKQVASEKWSLAPGNSRKEFSNVSGLQQGLYIISIINASGEVLLNTKVMKQ